MVAAGAAVDTPGVLFCPVCILIGEMATPNPVMYFFFHDGWNEGLGASETLPS